MSYNPDRHHRRSIRLRGYDYAQVGAYFATIVTHRRMRWLGRVSGGVVELSEWGRMAERELLRTPEARPNTTLDAYVVMPDHIHAIFVVLRREADPSQPAAAFQSPTGTLGAIVRGYKGAVTSQIRAQTGNASPLWLRNYHEHIVRDDEDLDRIRRYIAANPSRWPE